MSIKNMVQLINERLCWGKRIGVGGIISELEIQVGLFRKCMFEIDLDCEVVIVKDKVWSVFMQWVVGVEWKKILLDIFLYERYIVYIKNVDRRSGR